VVLSYSLIAAILVHLICQIFKLIFYSIKEGKFRLKLFFSAGGMPSTHAAFVSALTISIGLWEGFFSQLFAIAFVFSTVVIYDAVSLRGTVQKQSKVLNELMQLMPENKCTNVKEMVGHSVLETGIGIGIDFLSIN
jgi:acid phosphatase family membrane protein YuiD